MDAHSAEHESRIQEAEIEIAFLKRDLTEYKEVVRELHARLERAERTIQRLSALAAGEDESPDESAEGIAS